MNTNEDQSPRNQMINTMIFYRGSLACRQATPRCGDSLTWRFTSNWHHMLKSLVWFWIIDETLSANLVYQSDHEIGSTIPSDEAMTKIMTMVMAWL